ncbi:MAG: EamA family transporter [Burkholderiaceae bacterium]|jgi:drug/metabolite transporter (DMT)-like permease
MQRSTKSSRHATWLALLAIGLWASLAWFGVQLAKLPPFFVVGTALLVAGLGSLPFWIRVRVAPGVVVLGVYGLFGFHFLLFMALRYAPPLPANLVNYLWPLFIVVLAPLFSTTVRSSARHLVGAALGLIGAAFAIAGSASLASLAIDPRALMGYGFALASALIWATYSLGCQRAGSGRGGFPTTAVGLFCAASGTLAIACHHVLEPAITWEPRTVLLLFALGVGPMGGAFFLWDAALKRGDPRSLGSLAYLTPLLSTLLLAAAGYGQLGWTTLVALLLIVGGALLGNSGERPQAAHIAPEGLASTEGQPR